MLVAGAGCCVPPSPAPPLGRCFSWYCDSHDYRCYTIYTLSKLGGQTSLFHLSPLSFQDFFVSLHCIRIAGNTEE